MSESGAGRLAGLSVGIVLTVATLSGCGGGSPAVTASSVTSGYSPSMQAALKAADRIALDFTTYDFRNLSALYTTMRRDATPTFIAKVIDPTTADSQALQRRLKVISSGSVIASAAQPAAADGSVTVLLFVDQRLRSLGASAGRLEQQRMQLVLKEINGAWLVDQAKISGSS